MIYKGCLSKGACVSMTVKGEGVDGAVSRGEWGALGAGVSMAG